MVGRAVIATIPSDRLLMEGIRELIEDREYAKARIQEFKGRLEELYAHIREIKVMAAVSTDKDFIDEIVLLVEDRDRAKARLNLLEDRLTRRIADLDHTLKELQARGITAVYILYLVDRFLNVLAPVDGRQRVC
ncbi:unnamed protein product [Vitrella brassicaformis CCMP3155]|uniref:Uncharacterized protein n=1 Tax=Vitrella brassicaformis (strain CCMP3155) TaxID=1169540 RepID=A0A0G4H0Z0_VITBC|nr:unnamed protein product [Vitrella brassicaformis CCMP3155]|eukprot:CEM37153.1 unnamed protein product [Vitrella brassicaformis CCMP3155]